MLPVMKHADKVLICYLARKVASQATNNAMRKSDVDDATRIFHRSWSAARARQIIAAEDARSASATAAS